ncbi:MAG: RNA-binding S4 domain-containing protein [Clostridiales bacterium]|nr:RNA-binding S4 domain-containing protein [Clostridiales bacterium]
MRIDKYLKVARIIKRRTVAKEACDQGRVTINDKVAKASDNVSVNDVIAIEFGHTIHKYRVLDIREHIKKDEVSSLYEILS